MHDIQARKAVYEDVIFRSQTEAKWASFFHCLGHTFIYEHENFNTSLGWYVPDFYFPRLKTLIEIKPKQPTEKELIKFQDVCQMTNQVGFILCGFPLSFPAAIEPHLCNCMVLIVYPDRTYNTYPADDLYRICSLVNKKSARAIYSVNSSDRKYDDAFQIGEFIRYKKLLPAKAVFKPRYSAKVLGVTRGLMEIVKYAAKHQVIRG